MARVLRLFTGFLSFLYLILVLNLVQLGSVLLLPFSRRLVRSINRWCARSIWGLWVIMAERQNRIDVRFTGDAVPPRENALVLPNHQSMSDVLLLLCFAWRARRLGHLKFFVKDVVKYVPGPGWGMVFLDCIFVKRDWAQDRGNIERLFAKYKNESIPLLLVSFLEGTRRTPKKLAEAQAYAKERGLPVLEHVLLPRTKGFVFSVLGLRQHLDVVYDLTLGYETEPPPTLLDCFAGTVRKVDIHVRRWPIAELPEGDDALAAWATARYEEKDALLAHYKQHGAFPGERRAGDIVASDWFRSEESLPQGL